MNEPVFPGQNEVVYESQEWPRKFNPGISLRDYIAVKVMEKYIDTLDTAEDVAEGAYFMADTMLKEREK